MSKNTIRKENLFRTSVEKHNLKKAINEWIFYDEIDDYQWKVSFCELCDTPLEHDYLIINKWNERQLIIDETCLKTFAFDGSENYVLLKQEYEKKQAISVILDLLIKVTNLDAEKTRTLFLKYEKEGMLTQDQLELLFLLCEKYDVDYIHALGYFRTENLKTSI